MNFLRELLLKNQDELAAGLLAIAAVVVGFVLSSSQQIFATRYSRKKELNRILSLLLDLRDGFDPGSAIYLFDHISKLPDSQLKEISQKFVTNLLSSIINGAKLRKLDILSEELGKEISVLAQYEPIIAFKLRNIEDCVRDVQENVNNAKSTLHALGSSSEQFRSNEILIEVFRRNGKVVRDQIVWLAIKKLPLRLPSILLLYFEIYRYKKGANQDLLKTWEKWSKDPT